MKDRLFDRILTVFFPRRCVCCGKVICPDELFCENCDIGNCRIPRPKCPGCGQEEGLCNCSTQKFSFDKIIAPFYYENEVKDCIVNFKFRNYIDSGNFLAEEMVKTFEEEYVFLKPDMIVSVPLTRKRRNKRGFSQTDFLAEHISEETQIEFKKGLLKKVRETPPQVGLDSKARRENLVGAFAVSKDADVKGKTIIICDDNKTTGATLNECAKTLKKAGAENVIALTAALTKNDFRGEKD